MGIVRGPQRPETIFNNYYPKMNPPRHGRRKNQCMKIKAGYYIPQLPSKIAVTLLDGTTKIANLTPFRHIAADELTTLAAIERGSWTTEFFVAWSPFVYSLYGFEKVD